MTARTNWKKLYAEARQDADYTSALAKELEHMLDRLVYECEIHPCLHDRLERLVGEARQMLDDYKDWDK